MKKILAGLILTCFWANAQITVNVQTRSNELKAQLWQAYTLPSPNKNLLFSKVQPLASQMNHPLNHWFTVTFPDSLSYQRWIAQNSHQVAQVEPVVRYRLEGYNDPDLPKQYHHELIRTMEAHTLTQGQGVIIGIIDTGIDFFHPEFEGQLWINPAEDLNHNQKFDFWSKDTVIQGVSGDLDGIDQDGNGFIDDVVGYDFTDQTQLLGGGDYLWEDPVPLDDNQHGTLVAGIIGAKENNQIGGVGIAPKSKLMVLRAFAASGNAEDDDIARAILYATDNGAKILNFSFGDIYPSQMMHAAIQYAYHQGVTMVASAGNGTGDNPHYPSGFYEVISVSASMLQNGTEFLWPLSSYGGTVDLCAPGSGIYTTTLSDSANPYAYAEFSGTSTAAPMVSAAAALLKSLYPTLTPLQIQGILTSSADDIQTPGWDYFTGSGRLNLFKALQFPTSVNLFIHQPAHLKGYAQDTIPVITTVLHPLLQQFHLFYFQGDSIGTQRNLLLSGDFQHLHQPLYTWNVQNLPEGIYTLGLEIILRNGQSHQIRNTLWIDRSPPSVEIKVQDAAFENQEKKWLLVYRANEPVLAELKLTYTATNEVQTFHYDKITRNGHFLVGPPHLKPGHYEYKLVVQNLAGLIDSSQTGSFDFAPFTIPLTTLTPQPYKIPAGHYLPQSLDLDHDMLPEILYNEWDSTGDYSHKIFLSELNANQFIKVDSLLSEAPRLPKSWLNNELLTNLRDSIFLFQNPNPLLPKQATLLPLRYFPAQFADTDQDGKIEIIAKDFRDYALLEKQNDGSYALIATLPDTSSDYVGSTAPRVVVEDLDQDGKTDIAFGDYDGDLFIYENNADNQYELKWYYAGDLEKSSDAIVAGDLNANGIPECITVVRTSALRNDDYEYDPPYWKIKIWEANGNDHYQLLWQGFLYNHHSDTWTASSIVDVDHDGSPEWLFSYLPVTYLLDYHNGNYEFRWFHYGSQQRSHVWIDANYNGFPEISLITADSAEFFEWDSAASLLPDVAWFELKNCQDSVFLTWNAVPSVTQYLIWKAEPESYTFQSVQIVSQNYWSDTLRGPKWLAVSSYDPAFSPPFSRLSYAAYAFPHAPFTLDSVQIVSDKILKLFSSQPLDEHTLPYQILLNQKPFRSIVVHPGFAILEWDAPLQVGLNLLTFSTDLQDRYGGCLSTAQLPITFQYLPQDLKALFLTQWYAISTKQALLRFNEPLADTSLALDKFLSSVGRIVQVEKTGQQEVLLTFEGPILGNMGYEVRVKVKDLWSLYGSRVYENIGDMAIFAASPAELKEAVVYPNPALLSQHTKVTFAQIPNQTQVEIYTLSGRWIRTLKEQNGLGGVDWDLKDQEGKTIPPGTYLFKAKAQNSEFIGQFSVVE